MFYGNFSFILEKLIAIFFNYLCKLISLLDVLTTAHCCVGRRYQVGSRSKRMLALAAFY